MKPLVDWYGHRCFSDKPVGVASYSALDVAKVADDFACGPAIRFGLLEPLPRSDGVGGSQELGLGAGQFFKD